MSTENAMDLGEGTSKKVAERIPYQINFSNRRKLWRDFDIWMEEEPATRRSQFGLVKSAMLLHGGYSTVVVTHILRRTRMLTQSPNSEYTNFMSFACESKFFRENEERITDVIGMFCNIFSAIPEYSHETGVLRKDLKESFDLILAGALYFQDLKFSTSLFRSVFWQLVLTFKLDKEDGEEVRNRSQMMFSAFIAAILAAIFQAEDFTIGLVIPNYNSLERVADFLEAIISSPYFRKLSVFFIVSFWLTVKHRAEGESVFCSQQEHEEEMAETPIPTDSSLKSVGVFSYNDYELNRIQKDWEAYACDLLKQDLLQAPDGYRAVKKPRKYNKRKLDEESAADRSGPLETGKFKKPKTTEYSERFLSKKRLSTRANVEVSPVVFSPPPKVTRPVHLNPEDVGIGKPIYFLQKEYLNDLKDEIRQRRDPNAPRKDLKKYIHEFYRKCHRTEAISRLPKLKEPTIEQKLAHKSFMELYRRLDDDWRELRGVEKEPKSPEKAIVQQPAKITYSPQKKSLPPQRNQRSGKGAIEFRR